MPPPLDDPRPERIRAPTPSAGVSEKSVMGAVKIPANLRHAGHSVAGEQTSWRWTTTPCKQSRCHVARTRCHHPAGLGGSPSALTHTKKGGGGVGAGRGWAHRGGLTIAELTV